MTDNTILIIAIGMIGLGAGSFWLFITLVISEWLKNRAKAKRERKEAQQEEE